jgi:hypothetical protein
VGRAHSRNNRWMEVMAMEVAEGIDQMDYVMEVIE